MDGVDRKYCNAVTVRASSLGKHSGNRHIGFHAHSIKHGILEFHMSVRPSETDDGDGDGD